MEYVDGSERERVHWLLVLAICICFWLMQNQLSTSTSTYAKLDLYRQAHNLLHQHTVLYSNINLKQTCGYSAYESKINTILFVVFWFSPIKQFKFPTKLHIPQHSLDSMMIKFTFPKRKKENLPMRSLRDHRTSSQLKPMLR